MINKKIKFFIFLILILIYGCTKQSSLNALSLSRPINIVFPVEKNFEIAVDFSGSIEPNQYAQMSFSLPGRIDNCRVKEGDFVKKGEQVCRLDESVVNLELKRAYDAVAAARNISESEFLEKQKKLFNAGVIGHVEFEQLRLRSENAKASLVDAQTLLELAKKKKFEHELVAPWDGKILKLFAKPGQLISPEIPAVIIAGGKNGIQIKTDLPAQYHNYIHKGDSAKIIESAIPISESSELWKVVEKSDAINPKTQTISVVLAPQKLEDDTSLTTGLFVSGKIYLKTQNKSVVIPQRALYSVDENRNAKIFVVEQGKLKLQDLKIGFVNGLEAEVKSEIKLELPIVSEIAPDFTEGMAVEVNK